MQSEPTTFEETIIKNHVTLPSITFCIDLMEDSFTTFQDILDQIDMEKNKANSFFVTYGRNVESETVDLKNPVMIGQKLNISFEDLWSFAATVSPFSDSHLIICSSLNLGILKLVPAPGEMYYFYIEIETCLDKNFGMRFERHEPHQSQYNYHFNMNKGYQYFQQGVNQYHSVTSVRIEALKQTTHDCYEDNSMKMTDCVDRYIAEQLNCSLPWTNPHSDFGICSGADELTTFRTIHSKITSNQSVTNLEKKGCLKPNCL